MTRRIGMILMIFLISLIACTREEFDTVSSIRLINYTTFSFDSILITSYFPYDIRDTLMYYNLGSKGSSEVIRSENVSGYLQFIGYIGKYSNRGSWKYPTYPIDPAYIQSLPIALFEFGIIDCDTTNAYLTIGYVSKVQ